MLSVWNGKHTEIYAVPGFRSISMKSTRFSFGSVAAFLGALLIVVSLSFSLASCKTADDDNPLPQGVEELSADSPLIGKWKDSYDSYNTYGTYDTQISTSFIETSSYDKHEGQIYIGKIDDYSGYIYYQLSTNITGYDNSNQPYTIECKGKWSAVAYSNLKSTSVNMCDAYNSQSKYDFQNSLEECISLYTIDNGYFGSLSTTEFSKISD